MTTTTPPPPMPAMAEDPAVVAAQQLQRDYLAQIQRLRADFTTTPIETARRVVITWTQATQALAALQADLRTRRQQRLNFVAGQVPMGPFVDDNSTFADEVAILAAWRSALDAARNTDPDGRAQMLADSERFLDDIGLRAVLTVAYDNSELDLIDGWATTQGPEMRAAVLEWRKLSSILAGLDMEDSNWRLAAFRALPTPQESYDLPGLVSAFNATAQAHNNTTAVANRVTASRDVLDLSTLLTLTNGDDWYVDLTPTNLSAPAHTPRTGSALRNWWVSDPTRSRWTQGAR